MRPERMCVICLLLKKIRARGCCEQCYNDLARRDKLDEQVPRKLRKRDEWLEDWQILRARGLSKRQASVRMGYKEKTLERMLQRIGAE